jgi:PKD repeat protein
VNPLPDVAFGGTNLSGCTPLVTCFTDQTTVSSGSVTQWSWNFGDASPVSNVQNPCHTYTAASQYTVTLTATTNAGCSQTSTQTNYVDAHPVSHAAFTTTTLGPTVYFFDNSTSGVSWNWNFGDLTTSTLTDPVHVYTANGQFTVCHIAPNIYGCSDTVCSVVTITGVGIEENNAAETMYIFPNPARDKFEIRSGELGTKSEIKLIEIYDVAERQLFSRQLKAGSQQQIAVDVSEWKSGIYFIKTLDTDNNQRTMKLIKL